MGSWIKVADVLNTVLVYRLESLNGGVYGLTDNGRLYVWNNVDAWTQVAAPFSGVSNGTSLAIHSGDIYSGTYSNGLGLLYDDVNGEWDEIAAQLSGEPNTCSMVSGGGELYAGTSFNGKLFKWNGVNGWIQLANTYTHPTIGRIEDIISLAYYNGEIYGGTSTFGSDRGILLKYDGVSAWTTAADNVVENAVSSLIVHQGDLYGCTRKSGLLLKFNGSGWDVAASQYSVEKSIYDILSYGGNIYGSTGGVNGVPYNAKLLKWNGVDAWTELAGRYDANTSFVYSICELNGKIYGSPNTGMLLQYDLGLRVHDLLLVM